MAVASSSTLVLGPLEMLAVGDKPDRLGKIKHVDLGG